MTEAQPAPVPDPRTGVRGARRAAIIAIVASLSVTALVGIVVLLTGVNNEVLSKILGTTLVLAAFSVTSLCHLAVVGKAPQIVGFVGIVASGLAFVAAEVLLWSNNDLSTDWSQNWFRALGVLTVLALSLAHANLMLLLQSRERRIVRIGLRVTLALIALVAIGIWIPILDNGTFPDSNSDWYWRAFGVLAILDVLGTIVLPVTGAILRDTPRSAERQLTLPVELAQKLDVLAATQNTTREALALALLERSLEHGPGE
jgi:hypothetical protein